MRFQTAAWLLCATGLVACIPTPEPIDAGPGAGCVDAGCEGAGASGADGGVANGGAPLPLDCGALPGSGVTEGHEGNPADVVAPARRSLVLMGGSVEVDAAAEIFAAAAEGGDLLVLRASGAVDSYTPWFFEELSVSPPLNSAATLRIDDANVGDHPSVLCRVEAAEALWLAGGDQWDYLGRWPAGLLRRIGQTALRGAAVGGTSAGAMALGQGAFDAEGGSVTSAEALADPLSALVSVQSPLTAQPELAAALVDTHFTARDREGRLLAFLAVYKALAQAPFVLGIGLDERAALVIEGDSARVITGADERSVWLYGVEGQSVLSASTPLSLDGVWRAQLNDGDTLSWPPVPAELTTMPLTVTAGVVEVGAP